MQKVTLTYTNPSSVTYSQDFYAYSVNYLDVEFERMVRKSEVSSKYVESNVGYRYRMSIDFAPVGGGLSSDGTGRSLVHWLQAFSFGSARKVKWDSSNPDTPSSGSQRSVTLIGNQLKFDHYSGVAFWNGFTMEFVEQTLRTITDDGSTMRLIPFYQNAVSLPSISAFPNSDGSFFVNLVDEDSADLHKTDFSFLGGGRDDVAFGYQHRISFDFGVVSDAAAQAWLLKYVLYGSKTLYTGAINLTYGQTYNVAVLDTGLKWTFVNGMFQTPAIKLDIVETTLRTVTE